SFMGYASNSFFACSNLSSWRLFALISSSISAISALSFSACSRTTSTGLFFFHGLRSCLPAVIGGRAGAVFGSVGFCMGICFLLCWLWLVFHPRFELADRITLHRQFDVGVRCVNF